MTTTRDGYDGDRLSRSYVLRSLAEYDWTESRLYRTLARFFPRGVRRCPRVDDAAESALYAMESVPDLFVRFTDERLTTFYLRPAAEDRVRDIHDTVYQYVRGLRHLYPAAPRYELDLTQHVMQVLCEMPDEQAYDPAYRDENQRQPRNFTGWLYWVTRNQVDQYLGRERRALPATSLADLGEPAARPDRYPVGWDVIAARVADEFGPRPAELLRLHFREGLTIRQIAEATGESPAGLYKRFERLCARMATLGYDSFTRTGDE